MSGTHLTNEQLIAHLYGIADEGTKPHLDACEACQVRWAEIEERRRTSVTAQQPSDEVFARQRQFVLGNGSRQTPLRSAWLPVAAAALGLAGIVLLRPTPPSPAVPASSPAPVLEAGWFDEAYASSASVEPRAAQPLRELFRSGEQRP